MAETLAISNWPHEKSLLYCIVLTTPSSGALANYSCNGMKIAFFKSLLKSKPSEVCSKFYKQHGLLISTGFKTKILDLPIKSSHLMESETESTHDLKG